MNYTNIAKALAYTIAAGLVGYWYYTAGQHNRIENDRRDRIAQKQTQKQRLAADEKQHNQCSLVNDAIDVLKTTERSDLGQPLKLIEPCRRIFEQGCAYKVDVMLELNKIGRSDLFKTIENIGEKCTDEYGFASRHGMAALREHLDLLEAAVESAKEECTTDDPDERERD